MVANAMEECLTILEHECLPTNGIQEVARSIRVSSTNQIKAFSVHEHSG
jgi:hypothetical protein